MFVFQPIPLSFHFFEDFFDCTHAIEPLGGEEGGKLAPSRS